MGVVRALVAAMLAGVASAAGAEPWTSLSPLPEPRQEVAVAELGGRIYVIGGFRENLTIAATVEVYDPATADWSSAAPLPAPVHHAAAAALDGKLYVMGGWSDFFATPLSSVWAYDPGSNQWLPRAPMPTARGALAAAALDGKLYAVGGSPLARERDFAVYDPASNAWTPLTLMPRPRNHLAAGALGGRLLAVGGRSGGITGITPALDLYDPASGGWSPGPDLPTARGGIAAAVVGRFLCVFGGEGNAASPTGTFPQVEAYDSVSAEWRSLTPMPTPRHGIGAGVVGTRVHLPGGASVQGFGVSAAHEVYDASEELDVTPIPSLPGPLRVLLATLILAALGRSRLRRLQREWTAASASGSGRIQRLR
jgi:N-acetylneuraminic acid mutarotase